MDDIATVIADARAYVERRADQVKNPAVVLDIDETSLSNWDESRGQTISASSRAVPARNSPTWPAASTNGFSMAHGARDRADANLFQCRQGPECLGVLHHRPPRQPARRDAAQSGSRRIPGLDQADHPSRQRHHRIRSCRSRAANAPRSRPPATPSSPPSATRKATSTAAPPNAASSCQIRFILSSEVLCNSPRVVPAFAGTTRSVNRLGRDRQISSATAPPDSDRHSLCGEPR